MLDQQVVEKLGSRLDSGHQEVIAGAGARDVEQVAFRGVDLVEFGLIADPLDSCLRRQYLVIAGGDHHGRNSRPLAKCIVPTATLPETPPACCAKSTAAYPAASTAAMALSRWAFDRTNTPISCGV